VKLSAFNPFGSIRWALGIAALVPLIALYFMFNLIGQVYGTSWALYGSDAFGWNTLMIGLSLAGFGVFHAGAQAVLTGPVAEKLGPRMALIAGMACETTGLVLLAFATQGWMVFVLLPLFSLGGIGMPALQSVLTSAVDSDKQGQLQGVLASILSLASIAGPLVFSWVYFLSAPHWAGAIWLFAAAIYVATLPLILRTPRAFATSPRTAH
jgi:DHA1 family tetracycline resistance protein-like MFS transporter